MLNYAKADTLYTYAKGRYNIGTMTESEMLQNEINLLNAELNMLNARNNVDDYMQDFRYYLGINESVDIVVDVRDKVPKFVVDIDKALHLALLNSPDILNMELKKLESERSVALAKAQSGLTANLSASFGLSQTGSEINTAYSNPINQQYVQLGIQFPILDWGLGKGRVRIRQSERDMIFTQVEQERSDFEQSIQRAVKQFNLQIGKVEIAAKTDLIAERQSEVERRMYLLGESSIVSLNASINAKDNAKRSYINALYDYWSLYYSLRILTLYDFEKDILLTEDYQSLIK